MLEFVAQEVADVRAPVFYCQVKKWIGAFAAAPAGLEALVLARSSALHFPGIELNQSRNVKISAVISPDTGRVKVRVIRIREELARPGSSALKINSERNSLSLSGPS